MRLPQVSYADGIKTAKQDEFAGLNHNLGAKDGELWDMRNLCSDYSPLLATRSRRMLYKTLQVCSAGTSCAGWTGPRSTMMVWPRGL